MKRRLIRSLSLFAIVATLTFGFQNCSKVQFNTDTGNDVDTVSGGGNCNLLTLTVPIKVLFVVDISTSNYQATSDEGTQPCGQGDTCAPASDPTKSFRGGSITDFFDLYQTKTNFSWGFEVFADQPASFITSGGQGVFGNASAMQSAIQQFYNDTNDGGTGYLNALTYARNVIANDPDVNSTAAYPPIYNVIFASDGYPNESGLSGTPVQDEPTIDSYINGITNLAPGRIFLSGVYYGQIHDPDAAALIQNMATTGGGQFINVPTNTTATIPVSYLVTIPQGDCH